MATTYNNLSYGSSGDEVKKLQQSLVSAGYDVGTAGTDGNFGDDTLNALKKYQTDNGLDANGVADQNTLSKLYGTSSATNVSTDSSVTEKTQRIPSTTYDSSEDVAYQNALQALQQAQQNKPSYAGTYDTALQDTYDQIVNREKFQYDLNSDMLYQQYKDQYVNLGQMAMKDTMGQAAALTGGYGSTYGQMVGQQQYDAYLQQLNEVIPELYGHALDQYNAEGDRMLQQYGMLGDMRDDEYGRYQDALNQYWQNVSYQQGVADDLYNRGMTESEVAYGRQQDAYNNLVNMITTLGYKPTADELANAGMSDEQYKAYYKYYKKLNPSSSGGGGGGGTRRSSEKPDGIDLSESEAAIDADIATMKQNGMSDHEVVGYLSGALQSGQISQNKANELEKKYTKGWI